MTKLLIVQPNFTSYRLEIYESLAKNFNVYLIAAHPYSESGFDDSHLNDMIFLQFFKLVPHKILNTGFFYYLGTFRYLYRIMPDKILLSFNPWHLSQIHFFIYALIFRKSVYLHGQGLYKYVKIGYIKKIIYQVAIMISKRYICYTEYSRHTLELFGMKKEKLFVASNTIFNKYPCPPSAKSSFEMGILFIGRLREGSNLPLLIDVISDVNNFLGLNITLHIVGDGVEYSYLYKTYQSSHVSFYGKVYDQKKINEISLNCRVGCYPGNAGLSIVHYMSLSLPPIVHNSIKHHSGPEPSYLVDNINGFLFDYYNAKSTLHQVITKVFSMSPNELKNVMSNSFGFYNKLSDPPLSSYFLNALRD